MNEALGLLLSNPAGLGLTLAGSIFVFALIIVIGMVVYYINNRIDNLKQDLRDDYAKKIDLLEHQKGCNKDMLVAEVYNRIEKYFEKFESYVDKVDKKIDNVTDKFYLEIKNINENIIKMMSK